jgi:hypothetical protein
MPRGASASAMRLAAGLSFPQVSKGRTAQWRPAPGRRAPARPPGSAHANWRNRCARSASAPPVDRPSF